MEAQENMNKFESDQLNELYTALAKAQSEIEFAAADKNNPFFKSKYADMASVMRVAREPLTKNGLSVIQRVLTNSINQMYLLTRLCHASGQWIEGKMLINPAKGDIQSIGSYMTYVKRYSWSAIVGVTVGEEDKKDDDDGEAAMNRKENKPTEDETDAKGPITPIQIRELEKMLFDLPEEDEKTTLAWCQVDELKKIPKSKFSAVKKSLEKRLESKNIGVK